MEDFDKIRRHCAINMSKSRQVLDEFLMYYAAERDGIGNLFDKQIKKYKKAAAMLPQSTINRIKSQFILHRVFRENGLIQKYLNHSLINALPAKEYEFLRECSETPWRYSYGKIVDRPAKDFFWIVDEFTAEKYLLFSPGLSQTIDDFPTTDFIFNLISFNGECFETYGPIGGFDSVDGDDIFYFATEKSYEIESNLDLVNDLQMDPVPYCLLISAMGKPRMKSRGREIAVHKSEESIDNVDLERLQSNFKTKEVMGVYRFTIDEVEEFPHFAFAYYDTKSSLFTLKADTDFGYNTLREFLGKFGVDFHTIPDEKVHLTFLPTIENVLRRPMNVDPYATLFEEESEED